MRNVYNVFVILGPSYEDIEDYVRDDEILNTLWHNPTFCGSLCIRTFHPDNIYEINGYEIQGYFALEGTPQELIDLAESRIRE